MFRKTLKTSTMKELIETLQEAVAYGIFDEDEPIEVYSEHYSSCFIDCVTLERDREGIPILRII